jgi:hypothetical protein
MGPLVKLWSKVDGTLPKCSLLGASADVLMERRDLIKPAKQALHLFDDGGLPLTDLGALGAERDRGVQLSRDVRGDSSKPMSKELIENLTGLERLQSLFDQWRFTLFAFQGQVVRRVRPRKITPPVKLLGLIEIVVL